MHRRLLFLCSFLFVLSLLGGCAAPQVAPDTSDLRWPPPPFQKKIVWEREISGSESIRKPGAFSRFLGFFTGDTSSRIVRPYGIYVDSGQRLFVVDAGAGLVHIFGLGDNSYGTIEEKGEAAFRTPIGVTGDENGNIFVTDSDLGTVFHYATASGTLSPFTSKLARPTGIAFNRKNRLLYVSETGKHQIVAFDLQGKEKFRFGGKGNTEGKFNFPTDIFVDGIGRVLVTDALNARVQIFSPEGRHLRSFGSPGDTQGYFAKPKGVATDGDGHIYVADALFDTIQIFDDAGRLLMNFGENGSGPGQFWMPSGLHIAHNVIYVADTYNKRVQVFRYLP